MGPWRLDPTGKLFAKCLGVGGGGTRALGPAIQAGTPGSASRDRQGMGRALTSVHGTLQTKTWLGGRGETSAWMSFPGAGTARTPGSRAATPARSSPCCRQGGSFHAPQAGSVVGLALLPPCLPPGRRGSQHRQRGESEIKAAWRRGREGERERESQSNLAPPMGSSAAQRQVIISQLSPCSPAGWEEKGQRVSRGATPTSLETARQLLPLLPHSSRTSGAPRSPFNTPPPWKHPDFGFTAAPKL